MEELEDFEVWFPEMITFEIILAKQYFQCTTLPSNLN